MIRTYKITPGRGADTVSFYPTAEGLVDETGHQVAGCPPDPDCPACRRPHYTAGDFFADLGQILLLLGTLAFAFAPCYSTISEAVKGG